MVSASHYWHQFRLLPPIDLILLASLEPVTFQWLLTVMGTLGSSVVLALQALTLSSNSLLLGHLSLALHKLGLQMNDRSAILVCSELPSF